MDFLRANIRSIKIHARINVLNRPRREVVDSQYGITLLKKLFGQIAAYEPSHTGNHDAPLHVSTLLYDRKNKVQENMEIRHFIDHWPQRGTGTNICTDDSPPWQAAFTPAEPDEECPVRLT